LKKSPLYSFKRRGKGTWGRPLVLSFEGKRGKRRRGVGAHEFSTSRQQGWSQCLTQRREEKKTKKGDRWSQKGH